MKYAVRAGLAVAMLIGFYLFAVALAVTLVVAVAELLDATLDVRPGRAAVLVAVPIVLAVFYGLLFRTRESPPEGLLMSEQDQPRLWALAREIAVLGQTRDVNEIRLVPIANAAVSDSSSWLGLRRGTRSMFLGVPLLIALDEQQMRSVVAHELGHYSGRHTTLVRITYRGAESIRRILSQLGRRNPVAWLLRLYGQLYFAISRSVNRRQELEADQLAAQVAGAESAASALLELRPIAAAWDAYSRLFSDVGVASGRRPDGVLAGFAEFLADRDVATRLQELRDAPSAEKPSVYDTHPSVDVRVAALGVAHPAPRNGLAPATALLDAPDATLAALERELYPGELEPMPLTTLAPLAADDGARRHARAVDDLLRSQGRAPGLQTVMQYLGNGMSRDLVRHALPDDLDADTVTEATAAVIGGYLSAALLAGGGTEHRLDWSRGAVLVDRSGEVLDAAELVAEVMATPARAGELDELLRLTGASPAFRAEDGPASGPRERDPETAQVLGVLSPVNRADTFVVHEDGLLLLPEKVWQRHLAGPAPVTAGALMSGRGARDVPWEQVELVRLVHLAGGRARIICSVVGDEELVVKVGPRSGEGGAPYAVMRSRLEKRYRIEERIGTRM